MAKARSLSRTLQNRQLKRMSARHREILSRHSQGPTQRTIASEMGLSESCSIVVNSPIFQNELQKLFENNKQRLAKLIAEREEQIRDSEKGNP